eukprot:433021-Pelagomonas_calceolata.AAC.2
MEIWRSKSRVHAMVNEATKPQFGIAEASDNLSGNIQPSATLTAMYPLLRQLQGQKRRTIARNTRHSAFTTTASNNPLWEKTALNNNYCNVPSA